MTRRIPRKGQGEISDEELDGKADGGDAKATEQNCFQVTHYQMTYPPFVTKPF